MEKTARKMVDVVPTVVPALVVVVAFIAILYSLFYAISLYTQIRSGNERRNWKISALFYTGIFFFALSELLIGINQIVPGLPGQTIGFLLKFAALITFMIALHYRMRSVAMRYIKSLSPAPRAPPMRGPPIPAPRRKR